jgi:hypothetical protein
MAEGLAQNKTLSPPFDTSSSTSPLSKGKPKQLKPDGEVRLLAVNEHIGIISRALCFFDITPLSRPMTRTSHACPEGDALNLGAAVETNLFLLDGLAHEPEQAVLDERSAPP